MAEHCQGHSRLAAFVRFLMPACAQQRRGMLLRQARASCCSRACAEGLRGSGGAQLGSTLQLNAWVQAVSGRLPREVF